MNINCNILLTKEELHPKNVGNDYNLFELFMKSTNYKKLHIEIKNNLNINPQTGRASYISQPPYINETKKHCLRNNIEFTSNIGI